jgi:hypothetical protein
VSVWCDLQNLDLSKICMGKCVGQIRVCEPRQADWAWQSPLAVRSARAVLLKYIPVDPLIHYEY